MTSVSMSGSAKGRSSVSNKTKRTNNGKIQRNIEIFYPVCTGNHHLLLLRDLAHHPRCILRLL